MQGTQQYLTSARPEPVVREVEALQRVQGGQGEARQRRRARLAELVVREAHLDEARAAAQRLAQRFGDEAVDAVAVEVKQRERLERGERC